MKHINLIFYFEYLILGSSTKIPTTTVSNIPIETITSTVATSTQETSSQGNHILH